ncbi:hypothetical protein GUITHDRAFT_105859 [Guillardia theta CCMP2712]|uniref:EF-hand domain-containing protein n=2 Tax=Guillardia theta TaxID=55529 RepID=L1JJC8_GUITC|nr:hypothetical protein GUITHDRAFT_105859 [Guillardia theta CCMP2712]EKX48254.1 hypothetical protein GUITHDRAFT_105859 [Guillardia theta CCMP2712]|eukprot:XP_005835234.1 hypothetical protein GUITHDRAFT_105859 [Guillardia theta CCMP2712]
MAGKFALRHVVGSDVVNELMSSTVRQSQTMSQGVMMSFDFPMAVRTARTVSATCSPRQVSQQLIEGEGETAAKEEEEGEHEVGEDAALSLVMMGLLRKAINAKKAFLMGAQQGNGYMTRRDFKNLLLKLGVIRTTSIACGMPARTVNGVALKKSIGPKMSTEPNSESLKSFSDVGEKVVDLVWRKEKLDDKKQGMVSFETFSRVLFAQNVGLETSQLQKLLAIESKATKDEVSNLHQRPQVRQASFALQAMDGDLDGDRKKYSSTYWYKGSIQTKTYNLDEKKKNVMDDVAWNMSQGALLEFGPDLNRHGKVLMKNSFEINFSTAPKNAKGTGNDSRELEFILPFSKTAERNASWPRINYDSKKVPQRIHPMSPTEENPQDFHPLADNIIKTNPDALRPQGTDQIGKVQVEQRRSFNRGLWAPTYAHGGRSSYSACTKETWVPIAHASTSLTHRFATPSFVAWPDSGNPLIRKFRESGRSRLMSKKKG